MKSSNSLPWHKQLKFSFVIPESCITYIVVQYDIHDRRRYVTRTMEICVRGEDKLFSKGTYRNHGKSHSWHKMFGFFIRFLVLRISYKLWTCKIKAKSCYFDLGMPSGLPLLCPESSWSLVILMDVRCWIILLPPTMSSLFFFQHSSKPMENETIQQTLQYCFLCIKLKFLV